MRQSFEFRVLAEGIEAGIGLDGLKQIEGFGIFAQAGGIQGEGLAECVQGFGVFTEDRFDAGQIVPGFGNVGREFGQAFESDFEFGQIAEGGVFAGQLRKTSGVEVRLSECPIEPFEGGGRITHLPVGFGQACGGNRIHAATVASNGGELICGLLEFVGLLERDVALN